MYHIYVDHFSYRRNSRFGHGTQEDSHEVLRYLLSVLREEEIEVSCYCPFLILIICIHCTYTYIHTYVATQLPRFHAVLKLSVLHKSNTV